MTLRPDLAVEDARYYVYEHWRPDKNVCFYVGKGFGRRAHLPRRNRRYNNIAKHLNALGLVVEIRIVSSGLLEEAAFSREKELIKLYGRLDLGTGTLANCTNGGEGPSDPSAEVRAAISKTSIKTMSDPKNRSAVGEANRLKNSTPEARESNRQGQLRRWADEKKRRQRGEQSRLRWADPEYKERLKAKHATRQRDASGRFIK